MDIKPAQQRSNRWGYTLGIGTLVAVAVTVALWTYAWGWLAGLTGWPAETSFAVVRPYLLDAILPTALPYREQIASPWGNLVLWLDQYDLWAPFLAQLLTPAFGGLLAGLGAGRWAYTPGGADRTVHVSGPRLHEGKQAKKMVRKAAKKALGGAKPAMRLHPAGAYLSAKAWLQSVLIIGASGSGKTQVMLGWLRQALAGNPDLRLLMNDPKAEFLAQLYHRGETCILSPFDKRGTPWAISRDVRNVTEARQLAATTIPASSGEGAIWANSSRGVLTGCLVALATQYGPGNWGWQTLAETLASDNAALHRLMVDYHPSAAEFVDPSGESRTADSTRKHMSAFTQHVSDLARAWGNAERGVSLRAWARGKYRRKARVITIGHDASSPELGQIIIDSAFVITTTEIMRLPNTADDARRVIYVLDELNSVGSGLAADQIQETLERGRSKNVSCIIGAQSHSQLVDKWHSKERIDTVTGMCAVTVALATSGTGDTAKWLSNSFGQRQVAALNQTDSGRGNVSTSWQTTTEPVVRPDKIIHLTPPSAAGVQGYLAVRGWGDVYQISWPLDGQPDRINPRVDNPALFAPIKPEAEPTRPKPGPAGEAQAEAEQAEQTDQAAAVARLRGRGSQQAHAQL